MPSLNELKNRLKWTEKAVWHSKETQIAGRKRKAVGRLEEMRRAGKKREATRCSEGTQRA